MRFSVLVSVYQNPKHTLVQHMTNKWLEAWEINTFSCYFCSIYAEVLFGLHRRHFAAVFRLKFKRLPGLLRQNCSYKRAHFPNKGSVLEVIPKGIQTYKG